MAIQYIECKYVGTVGAATTGDLININPEQAGYELQAGCICFVRGESAIYELKSGTVASHQKHPHWVLPDGATTGDWYWECLVGQRPLENLISNSQWKVLDFGGPNVTWNLGSGGSNPVINHVSNAFTVTATTSNASDNYKLTCTTSTDVSAILERGCLVQLDSTDTITNVENEYSGRVYEVVKVASNGLSFDVITHYSHSDMTTGSYTNVPQASCSLTCYKVEIGRRVTWDSIAGNHTAASVDVYRVQGDSTHLANPYGARLVFTGANDNYWFRYASTTPHWNHKVISLAGKTMTFGANVFAMAGSTSVKLVIYEELQDGTETTITTEAFTPGQQEWKEITHTFAGVDTLKQAHCYIQGGSAGADCYVSCPMLVEGLAIGGVANFVPKRNDTIELHGMPKFRFISGTGTSVFKAFSGSDFGSTWGDKFHLSRETDFMIAHGTQEINWVVATYPRGDNSLATVDAADVGMYALVSSGGDYNHAVSAGYTPPHVHNSSSVATDISYIDGGDQVMCGTTMGGLKDLNMQGVFYWNIGKYVGSIGTGQIGVRLSISSIRFEDV